jgi:hypothetical protein
MIFPSSLRSFPDGSSATSPHHRGLGDAVAVCGLSNLMNGLVERLGIPGSEEYFRASARRLADDGYAALGDLI